jgi:hypothetical protein
VPTEDNKTNDIDMFARGLFVLYSWPLVLCEWCYVVKNQVMEKPFLFIQLAMWLMIIFIASGNFFADYKSVMYFTMIKEISFDTMFTT